MGVSPMLLLVTSTVRTSSVILVDAYVYLAPYAAFAAAMFAHIPLAFTSSFDPRAVDKEIQWPL